MDRSLGRTRTVSACPKVSHTPRCLRDGPLDRADLSVHRRPVLEPTERPPVLQVKHESLSKVLAGVRRSIVGDELSEQIPIEEIQLPLGTLAPLLACQILWVPLELFTPLCVGSRIAVGIRRPKSPSKPLPSEKRRIMKIPSMRVLMSNRVAQSQTRLARLVGQVPR